MPKFQEEDWPHDTRLHSFDEFVSSNHPSSRHPVAVSTRGEWWGETQVFLTNIYYPIIFGLFAVFSLQATGVSNDQSQIANQLALLSLCAGNFVSRSPHLFFPRLSPTPVEQGMHRVAQRSRRVLMGHCRLRVQRFTTYRTTRNRCCYIRCRQQGQQVRAR